MSVAGLFALVATALFTGAAFYISIAEQPARLKLDDRAMLRQWRPAYARGYDMQASLAIVGALLGIAAWWPSGDPTWLAGAVAIAANWPFTLLVIMPVNKRLEAMEAGEAGDPRPDMHRWGALHLRRGLLGVVATVAYLIALSGS